MQFDFSPPDLLYDNDSCIYLSEKTGCSLPQKMIK